MMQEYIKVDRQLAELGCRLLFDDLTSYRFVTAKGLKTAQEVVALQDPKILKFNVEDLLDQRILSKVVKSGM